MTCFTNLSKLIIAVVISELAGVVGALFTAPAILSGWYASLAKPEFAPPNWVFAPVWTIIFALMGIALFLVWKNGWTANRQIFESTKRPWNRFSERLWTGSWQKANVIAIFAVQLFLNMLWSVLFFGLKSPGLAFGGLLALWFAILFTIINFYRISRPAAWLLVPYILWVTFAGYLNYSIWRLNDGGRADLPIGYTLDSYRVERVLDVSCRSRSECETPGEFLIQSRCPFTSLCLENKCTVVCPSFK